MSNRRFLERWHHRVLIELYFLPSNTHLGERGKFYSKFVRPPLHFKDCVLPAGSLLIKRKYTEPRVSRDSFHLVLNIQKVWGKLPELILRRLVQYHREKGEAGAQLLRHRLFVLLAELL